MRQPSATEKYKAVNEGKMAKQEFVRQMRQQFPNLVSTYDTFDSTVKILKYKGMIFEAWSNPSKNISDDSIRRGLNIEIAALGHDPSDCKDEEVYEKAKAKAIANIEKDPLYYYNLLAKESSKVDKNDKMKETKRGALEKDTFNDMKKAALKEGYTEEQINAAIERLKEKKSEPDVEEINVAGHEIDDTTEKLHIVNVARPIKAKYGDIPGFASLLKDFLKTHMEDIKAGNVNDPIAEFDDFVDLNYDRLDEKDGAHSQQSDDEFLNHIQNLHQANQKRPKGKKAKREEVNERGGHYGQALINVIKDMAADFDGDEVGAAEEAMEFIGQEYEIDFEFGAGESRQQEAKGKDHDGDGDIDSDDYMAAKDKAIKKAMGKDEIVKESIKNIITKVLEEQMINEAATNELARLADDYAGFEGMKSAILDLQNIVTDIEAYYDKTRDKIQKVYERLGEIRNEEGLKVGGFLAPAIEAAFNKDLRPAVKRGFTKGLETPKVRVLSKADIDAHNSGERPLGETEIEEPKQNVFSPIAESKKKK